MMKSLYRRLPFDFRDAYLALFRQLEDGNLPLVFNCTAGKDRTGVAAALILFALGVERDVIFDDYLLSERCFEQSCELILNGKLARLFAGVEREVWEPVMRVDTAYLDATFDELSSAYGSIDGYLKEALGISDGALERIRQNLLD
jgi:protein-tyrosine phosphatase